jgi:hypothetical protein
MAANRFELLATWYLRFNGYFTTPDFTVHPDFRRQAGGTDADVLAVRFPHSEEYQRRFNFVRDPDLVRPDRTDFLICEVKAGRCDINQKTWRDPARENVEYVIRWMGFESDAARIKALAKEVYEQGECNLPEKHMCVRFVCFGSEGNAELKAQFPRVHEVYHPRVIGFLRDRFSTGCNQITRENWDADIIEFAELVKMQSDAEMLEWARQESGQP